jgi:hypothetical protein
VVDLDRDKNVIQQKEDMEEQLYAEMRDKDTQIENLQAKNSEI